MLIDATTNHNPQPVRVSRNTKQVADQGSSIRFTAYALLITSFGYMALKVISSVGGI